MSFRTIASINPKKLPIADFIATFEGWLFMISAANAPTNGPKIIPNGGKKMRPANNPNDAPNKP